MVITFSTCLTCLRIFLLPFIAHALITRSWVVALCLFFIAAVTDVLDGYFARRWKQETQIGAVLDPLADKLLMLTCYVVLVYAPAPGLVLPVWFLVLVAGKELVLLLGAAYFSLIRHSIKIRSTAWGKAAMLVQVLFVGWLLVCVVSNWSSPLIFNFFLGVTTVLVIASLVDYSVLAVKSASSSKWTMLSLCIMGFGLLCDGSVAKEGSLVEPVGKQVCEQEFFLAEPKSEAVKNVREKKYSEVHDELLEGYEKLLHAYSDVIRTLTYEQEDCMDRIRKLAQNIPKASRKHIEKELKKVESALDAMCSCSFMN